MRSVVVLIFFLTVSFGDLDFNSKVRKFNVELLYHTVPDSNDLQDFILSPYLIWSMLLSLAYETSGVTREQFAKVLSLADDRNEVLKEFQKLNTSLLVNDEDRGIKVLLSNFLFYDENFNVYSDVIGRLENDYGFITERLNFEDPLRAVKSAREFLWSNNVRFFYFLNDDFVNVAMQMCTALEFSLRWSKLLNWTEVTEMSTSRRSNVFLIHVKAPLRYTYSDLLDAGITELPYEGDYCMLHIRSSKHYDGYNVQEVFRNLREVPLEHILAKLQSDTDEHGLEEQSVYLPIDPIVARTNLQKALFNTGLSDVFDQDSADFNNFAEDDIYIGEILQEALITFDTSKTKGFASTTRTYDELAKWRNPGENYEPYIFLIMHKSSATVLVAGYYSEIVFDGDW